MQRWAHFLSGFDYKIGHVKSEHNIADFASRFPTESWKLWKEEDSYINFINQDECGLVELERLAEESKSDPELAQVIQALSGLTQISQVKSSTYRTVLKELSLEKGIVMRGHRVVVPRTLRCSVLDQLHRSHLGIVKSKSIARSSVWWPGIDHDLENCVKNCSACLLHCQSPPMAKLIPWKPAERVWGRVHVDFAGPVKGLYYLIVVDALSKWVEVFPTKNATSEFVLDKLVECISRFGLFDELVSDNGTQFLASDVQVFLKSNGVTHKLTSPGHPATNGEAENMVKTFKSSLLKCLSSENTSVKTIVANFLIGYRKSVHCTTKASPCQMMLGRDIKTSLDLLKPNATGKESEIEVEAKHNILQQQQVQVRNFHGSREAELVVGDRVISRDYTNPNRASWTPAVVTEVLGPRNYRVRVVKSNRLIKRHIDQLKKDSRDGRQQQPSLSDQSIGQASKSTSSTSIRKTVPVKRSLVTEDATNNPEETLSKETDKVDTDEPEAEIPVGDTPEVAMESTSDEENEQSVNGVEAEIAEEDTQRVSADEQEVATRADVESNEQCIVDEDVSSEDSTVSVDEETGLVVSGFERGFWRLRDEFGRMFKK